MDDPNVDIIMPWFVFQDDPLEETIVDVLAGFQELAKKSPFWWGQWEVRLLEK